MYAQSTAEAAALPVGVALQSTYRHCANPGGAAYPVCIERSRVLPSGAADGRLAVRSFGQVECQALSIQQTARDTSRQNPPLTRCEKNALSVHRAIGQAYREGRRSKTAKGKGTTLA